MQTHIRSTFDSDKTNSDAWVTEGVTRSTALRPASALPSPPSPGAASRTRHRGLRVRPEVYVSGYTSPYAGPPFRDTWPAAGAGPSYVAPPLRPAPGSRFTLTCAAPLADEDTPFPDRTAPSPGADARQRHGPCHDHARAPPAVRLRAARPAQGPPPRGPPPRGRHFRPLPARSHCFRQGPRPPAVGECRPVSSAFLLISRAKPTST